MGTTWMPAIPIPNGDTELPAFWVSGPGIAEQQTYDYIRRGTLTDVNRSTPRDTNAAGQVYRGR